MTLPFPKAVLDQHSVVLGKTRSGKSSTMRVAVEWLLDNDKPVGIIDPKGDWWGIKSSASGKEAGYQVVIFGGLHADVPINAHSGKAVAELVAGANRPYLIDLGGWMVGERTRFFVDFASALFVHTRGHRWLVIDECHNFAPQGKVLDPDAGKMLHWANRLASEGSGKGLILLSASQRPQKVHKDYLTSHETLIAKRVIHPLDRGAVKDWIDGCGNPAKGREVLDSLAGLQRSQAWVWSPEIGFGPKLVEFPMFKTYDSFAVQTGSADRKLKGWASVDLDEVKQKLARAVEEAKANDPTELRKEIAALKAERVKLERQIATPTSQAPDKDVLKAAEQKGFDQAKKKFGPAADRAFQRVVAELTKIVAMRVQEVNVSVVDALKEFRANTPGIDTEVSYEPSAPPTPLVQRPAQPTPRIVQAAIASPPASGGAFTRPQMRVLRSLAMWKVLGHEQPTREMVAVGAAYAPGSGNFNNIVGGLGTLGVISIPVQGRLTLEAADIETPSVDEGREALLSILANPHRKIVAVLNGAGVMSRDAVAEGSGFAPGSGNFNNLVGRLNTLGISYVPQQSHLALSDWAQELLSGHEIRSAA